MEWKEEGIDISTTSLLPQFKENMHYLQIKITNQFPLAYETS